MNAEKRLLATLPPYFHNFHRRLFTGFERPN